MSAALDWMADLTWKCDVCHAERPDDKISVWKVDISPSNLPAWTIQRNVKYCNDNPRCKAGAENWKEKR